MLELTEESAVGMVPRLIVDEVSDTLAAHGEQEENSAKYLEHATVWCAVNSW